MLKASCALVCVWLSVGVSHGSEMTVDLTKPGAPLKKGGLGTLFGISTIAGGTPANLITGTILHITASLRRMDQILIPLIRSHR